MNTRTTKDGPFCWASKEVRHRIRHRFSQSNSVCSALGIYAALCELASDACAESFVAELPLIANVAGVGKRTAQTILPELVALGVLAIEKRTFPGTNMDAPSVYTLLSVQAEGLSLRNGCTPLRNGCTPLRNGCTPLRNGCTPLRKNRRTHSLRTSEEEREESKKKGIEENDAAAAATPPAETPPAEPLDSKSESPAPSEQLASLPGFQESWADFQQMRRSIRKPLTEVAIKRLLPKLARRPADAVAGLEMAIENSWQGFEWEWFDNRRSMRGETGSRGGSGESNHRDSPQKRDEPSPSEIAAWISACARPGYAAKQGEWTSWDRLPSFAKDEFFRDRRTARAAA